MLGSRTDDAVDPRRLDRLGRARRPIPRSCCGLRCGSPGPRARADSLSGGNQQKLVIARELARAPRIMVAENPTRGLDLRATVAVHARLRAAADAGAAVLVHSSDLDEVLELADRVLVVAEAGDGAPRRWRRRSTRSAR